MADRLANEKELVEKVIQEGLDRVDALRINHDNKSHPKTFIFAMALGVGFSERIPTNKRLPWLQYSAINNSDTENRAYAISLALQELRKNGKDNLIADDDNIYGIASEYANSGLQKIREMIPDFDQYDEDDFVQQLITLMDNKYDEIMTSKDKQ